MGEVFAGRYELIDPIGRGGVGAVWRSWDHRRRRYVAAKVLQQSDAHTLLRFVREQAMRIDHPHVLAPASWAADDDKVLFTMDLVSGGSLAHLIGDYGPLPPRFVCTLLDQLLSGLAAVHAEGVVHRDIKPANILLEATGTGRPHLRLSDFGISMRKGEPRLTETNYVVGTPGYFAPEQLMGAEPDFPADLFAVGLVALYLLSGRKPDSQALIEHFADFGVPSAPEDVPEPLWQVIANLLQPDPHARFRTATGARKALTAAAEMLPEGTVEEERVEVFDHIGPLPAGFGTDGPVPDPAPDQATGMTAGTSAEPSREVSSETGSFQLAPPLQPPDPQPAQAAQSGQSAQRQSGRQQSEQQRVEQFQAAQQRYDRPDSGGQPPHRPSSQLQQPTTPPASGATPATGSPSGGPDHSGQVPSHPSHPSQAAISSPDAPYGPSQAPTAGVRHEYPHTRPYTAQSPQVPVPTAAPTSPGTPGTPAAAPANTARRRPGPPPKVAVPVLIVALLCLAVGVWALLSA
ncbi:serine/threonine-protein kinase [Streptomyces sp. H27-D2]|uniref:serine/threonine-protein kinase n=1 Tax=Streptomyces sp. H27-D2 TaxID=3046304 RepID=UPI002DC04B89|nr:protein kinase [Streptomyces sp. H27-D2]MEC4015724.1 protein kinase [Streptomyces sp. H27-D2]